MFTIVGAGLGGLVLGPPLYHGFHPVPFEPRSEVRRVFCLRQLESSPQTPPFFLTPPVVSRLVWPERWANALGRPDQSVNPADHSL